jgi:purine-binding chemotaxis protein CheW
VSSDAREAATEREGREYLTFFIAGNEWALGLEHVREVISYDTVTRVPGMPSTVRGVTNLRGSVVPVIDLAIKFQLTPIEVTSRTCIVLVEMAESALLLGLLIEEVGQVLKVAREELLPPPSFGTAVPAAYLEGMLPIGKRFGLVLDANRALSAGEILSMELAAAPVEAQPAADSVPAPAEAAAGAEA